MNSNLMTDQLIMKKFKSHIQNSSVGVVHKNTSVESNNDCKVLTSKICMLLNQFSPNQHEIIDNLQHVFRLQRLKPHLMSPSIASHYNVVMNTVVYINHFSITCNNYNY